MVLLLGRWWMAVLDSRRGNRKSFPEDPDFVKEREAEIKKREKSIKKIYISPHECRYQLTPNL
jgi:hypothetical protein